MTARRGCATPILALARLFVLTDDDLGPAECLRVVERSLAAGCPAVQLRRKRGIGAEVEALAVALRTMTERTGALLCVNDRIDVALAVNADGVHLGGDGMDARRARDLLGASALLGRSIHRPHELDRADSAALDYVQIGPVFATASKARFGAPQGLDGLATLARQAHDRGLGVVAVGGITHERVPGVLAAGADAVAVIAAVCRASDPALATRALLDALAEPFPAQR